MEVEVDKEGRKPSRVGPSKDGPKPWEAKSYFSLLSIVIYPDNRYSVHTKRERERVSASLLPNVFFSKSTIVTKSLRGAKVDTSIHAFLWLRNVPRHKHKAMALSPNQRLCSRQRRSIIHIALLLYTLLLIVAAALLIWAGLYLYFVPAIASVAPLILGIACTRCTSAVETTGPVHRLSDQFESASSESIHLKIEDEFHHLEFGRHPAVHVIKGHEDSCINLQPWRTYMHNDLIAATNNFDQSNLLGKGGQADVYRGVEVLDNGGDSGRDVRFGRSIAVKRFYFAANNAEELRHANLQFKREVQVLSRASHRNVVEFYGYCIHGSERLLVSELVPNGSLHDFLFRPVHMQADPGNVRILDWSERLSIAKDAARGLDYLHNYCKFNLVHLDIKPQNILLDEKLRAKIADFGLVKLMGRDQTFVTGGSMVGGTPGYRAPELNCLVKGWESNITKKADVYSFGIVLLQLASGRTVSSLPTVDSAAPSFEMPGQTFRDAAFHLVKTQQTHLLIDTSLEKAACNSKVGQRMLEIGAMCVEMNLTDRPDMHKVNELLDGITL